MTTASTILKKLEAIDLLKLAGDAISNTEDAAVKEQREQLSQGLKADGTYQPDYSPKSVTKYGKPAGPIKLYDTGAYYAGLKVQVKGENFSIDSTDEKDEYLEAIYHPLGLGVLAKTNYIRTLQPEFLRVIKLQLK